MYLYNYQGATFTEVFEAQLEAQCEALEQVHAFMKTNA